MDGQILLVLNSIAEDPSFKTSASGLVVDLIKSVLNVVKVISVACTCMRGHAFHHVSLIDIF